MKRTPDELAAAVEVPVRYIEELIAGARQPARGRTDVYERMTSFLQLGRNDLMNCIPATPGEVQAPKPQVRRMLLALCNPDTAPELERRTGREFGELAQRILDVAQGAVRRMLDDHIQLRLAAADRGASYSDIRLEIIDFLEATPGTLTAKAVTDFLTPRIERWDVAAETGVLRVVLKPSERSRRGSGRNPAAARASVGLDEESATT